MRREIERISALADTTVSPSAADAMDDIADRMERTLYATTEADRERERQARAATACPVCKAEKSIGPVVCWGECWRDPWLGLKASPLPAGVWLAARGVA